MSEPTRTSGAPEGTDWTARPGMAVIVRLSLFIVPVLVGSLAIWVTSRWFWSIGGASSTPTWFAQAALIGGSTATIVDRQSRRFLPLATLLGLSLTFPDSAPSRVEVVLRAIAVRDTDRHLAAAAENGLSDDPATAAVEAIGLVTVRSSHGRLTSGRTELLAAHANAIAVEMGVSDDDRAKLTWSVLLHDIGELCVPSGIRNANRQLTAEETTALRAHATAGEAFTAPLGEWLGSWRFATSQHYERWDGAGYPKGIGGERITLSARIVAVVNAYAALTAESSNTPEQAKAEILASSGAHFDPSVVQAMLAVTPIDEPSRLASKLPAIGAPGVAVHAAQSAAVVIAAALMATNMPPTSQLLALGPAVEAPADETSMTTALAPDAEDTEVDTHNPSTTERWEFSLTERTWPTPSTTSPTAAPTSTTAPPTTAAPTTIAAPTTTAAPPTTAPRATDAPTTTVASVNSTVAPAATTPIGPVAVADDANARQDRNKRINVLVNDAPGPSGSPIDVDTLDIVEQPAHGIAEIKSGRISYRSEAGYVGIDTLTYRICNGLGVCSTAKATITVK